MLKWTFQAKKPFQIMILNKTVPSLERHKHRSFHWVLNHEKIVKSNKRSYSFVKDYFGFVPIKPFRNRQYEIRRVRLSEIIDMAEEYQAAYYIDTYGVYFNDWYKGISENRRSRKIYGGLNNNDYLFLKEMKDRKKLIVGEYNLMAFPTPDLERTKVEELFDINWTGWIGKYFESLDPERSPELPEWIVKLYESQYKQTWDFHKSGIVFVRYNNNVVVLENETHLDMEVPYIITTKAGMEKYGLPYKVHYSDWFDVIVPGNNIVTSFYKIFTNEVGDSILMSNFIPNDFPAVIESPSDSPYFYFCGDFSNNAVWPVTAYCKNIEKISHHFHSDRPGDQRKFFWEFYKPLISGILEVYSAKVE